jgi:hypothetical protein
LLARKSGYAAHRRMLITDPARMSIVSMLTAETRLPA